MKKKIGMYLLIVLVIFFALIALEVSIRGIGQLFSNVRENMQKKKEENVYQSSEEYQIDTFLESSVKDIISLLKSENYESLYTSLDKVFIDYRSLDNVNIFQEYLKEYIPSLLDARLIEWKQSDNRYICTIAIDGEGSSYTRIFLISQLSDGTYNVIFDNVLNIEKISNTYFQGTSLFEFNIKYILQSNSSDIYVIDVSNRSSEKISGSFQKTTLRKSNGSICSALNDLSDVQIDAGNTKRILFEMDDISGKGYPAMEMNIVFQNSSDSQEVNVDINLQGTDI